ncbi:uncharacterized protein [Blastocystis hominis]|uniref:THO complex subunit 2 N-terminal domain-containing protein n=1 Tax=Blastocystis hominis TaxID=12968 RepID=D8M3Z3_BLAHO|nr:uncharacterized protein [Blastocystis hominis]CBK22782.2 unnamed protein product [Blastocystis hominis]|eukprot:XP_012896830.1 uncharacterized protein [Blastocystis hominis]
MVQLSTIQKFVKESFASSLCNVCLELDKLNLFRLTQQDDFTKRIKRINTQRYYTQHKFNLIREENEGYSKLLTFLHQSKLTESTLLSVISNACEFEPSKYMLIRNLFSEFKTEEISRILRFKFVFYQTHNDGVVPSSLLLLSAQLCRDGFVSLDSILSSFASEEVKLREFAQSRFVSL